MRPSDSAMGTGIGIIIGKRIAAEQKPFTSVTISGITILRPVTIGTARIGTWDGARSAGGTATEYQRHLSLSPVPTAPGLFLCAEYERQLGGGSPFPRLMTG